MPDDSVKSPLKSDPLRVPGQSLSGQIIDNAFDSLVAPYFMAAIMVIVAGVEWIRWFLKSPPAPWLYTVVALLAVAWASVKIRRGWKRSKAMKLGRDGERAVGQYLERFASKGFKVFHDIPNGDANIDHVLIGPKGVYTVETKTLSKPSRGQCVITVSEGGIQANGRLIERDAIVQAKAQARWLHNFFAESDFKTFVQPVVVFPGWYVEKFDMKATGAWVLEPKSLEGFLEQQPDNLSPDTVRAMGSALGSFVRQRYGV